MLNRRLVIGSLVAGAFLLPALANAGVTGVCSNCHTMHSSQNGVAATLSTGTLLKAGADCFTCHANPAVENGANGRGLDAIKAPQVDNAVGSVAGYVNNAGFFDAAADDNTHHNVVGIDANSDANMTGAGATQAPGGTFALDNAGAPVLTCGACHTGSGAHHGTTPSTYRILSGASIGTMAATDFGAAADTATIVNGTRSEVAYNATNANAFCATCHGTFHQGALGFAGAGNQLSATAGTWIRHPTDISLTGSGPSLVQASVTDGLNAATDTDQVVLGSVGGTTDVVMCLSCHVPHGGRYADLLAFPYDAANNAAGDAARSTGCETCHSYGVAGM